MRKAKRVIIATLLGVVFGFVCLSIAASGSTGLPYAIKFQIVLSRTLIGFAIGISSLKLHWTLQGLLMGTVFSLPLAFSGLMAPETPEFSAMAMFISTIVMGMIYGFFIELIVSVFFRLKVE